MAQKKTIKEEPETQAQEQWTKAYKGFDKDLKCRDFQYEIGKEYKHEGEIKLCEAGFHACLSPLDVFTYYSPESSRYAEVELLGVVRNGTENDTKVVTKNLRIVRELSVSELIEAEIKYVTLISETSDKKAASSGDNSTAASSGYNSTAASSGYYSKAASSGNNSTAASSGYYSKAASSGYNSKAASSGNNSTAASSGYNSTAASSGDNSTAASSGDNSTAACYTNGFACIAGVYGQVRGNEGSALSLGYIDENEKNRIAVAYVGENGIEPGVWYKVNNKGEFLKA